MSDVYRGRALRSGKSLAVSGVERIHIDEGTAFSVIVTGAAVAQNGTLLVQIKDDFSRAKTVRLRKVMVYGSQSPAKFEILEAPTVTDGTTALTPRNKNRNKADAISTVTGNIVSDPTSISSGTAVEEFNFVNNSEVLPDDWELELNNSKNYVLRLTNLNASAAVMYLRVLWVEE